MVSSKKKIVLAIGMAFGVSASAQEPADGSATPAMTLGQITVLGQATGPLATRNVLTSVDVLQESRISSQAVNHNWQLFGQMPGVMLTQYGQGTVSGKISMRGFTGEGEINAVKLLIDGVPSNTNDGMMPYIDLVPLLDIQSIELVRGTNDPRYGLHNISGNANIVTKIGGNYRTVRAGYGSFATRDLQAAVGIDDGSFSQNYSIAYQNTNGYRAHSDAEKLSFSGKWFYSPDAGNSRYGLIVRHHDVTAEEPGFLTRAQARADRDQSMPHNATDGGTRRMSQVALQAETDLGNQLFWTAQLYNNDIDDRRFVTFSAGSSQQERIVAENHVGASTTLTWRPAPTSAGQFTVVGGLDTERQDNENRRYFTAARQRTELNRNQQFDFNTVGGFVQAIYKPTAALTITPAYRVDKLSGSFTNALNNRDSDINDYGLIRQPKISAVYKLDNGYSVYGNWGRTFQVGIGAASYKVNQANDLEPSINTGWETGVKFRPLQWVEGRIALWQQYATNEARRKINDPSNSSENIGETRRRGIDLQLNVQPTARLGIWVGAAVQRAVIMKADAASIDTQGNEIDHVPHLLYNLGVDYKVTDALRLSGSVAGQSSYYLNRQNNTDKFGQYFLVNASAVYSFSDKLDLELQVRNLANRYYEYVWLNGSETLHAPGNPRSVHLMLTGRF
ncbi:TonB-dependent receptor [Azohydromonas aeria]|uniref:TonB-dependent receptor n=1 Tax=Azohydromonas aeria TaxID=2590212 RepID=UPI0012FB6437|nr:TonB-dependent receptor [Azohydromonas aeria]